jgi:hypothetical protein
MVIEARGTLRVSTAESDFLIKIMMTQQRKK